MSLTFTLLKAKSVLRWKDEQRETSLTIWRQLGDLNVKIYDLFQELSAIYEVSLILASTSHSNFRQTDPNSYDESIRTVGSLPFSDWLRMKANVSDFS